MESNKKLVTHKQLSFREELQELWFFLKPYFIVGGGLLSAVAFGWWLRGCL